MKLLSTPGWNEYQLLDSGNGERLEKLGKYILRRPDPQCIWLPMLNKAMWEKADAIFVRKNGKEFWQKNLSMPDSWQIKYNDLTILAKLTPFKHTGVFPEQSLQWEWIKEKIITAKQPVHVLNLFAYTGIASLIAAESGAKVTHVDASKATIAWARENQHLSGLEQKPIRWILDDAVKFAEREVRRGVHYDGIIMDPPIYGHGPNGELWDFPTTFPELIKICDKLLSDNPLFIIVNAYAISASSLMLQNVLESYITKTGTIEHGELALAEKESNRLLSTGIFARWYITEKH